MSQDTHTPADLALLKSRFHFHPDFPKKGLHGSKRIDTVVGLDARGFLLGPIVAMRLGAGFVPVRKAGKLPGKCVQAKYGKEYGEDVFEMQADSISKDANVLIIDDLIATGGSAKAAGDLVKQAGGKTVEYIFIVGGSNLKGAEKLDAPAYRVAFEEEHECSEEAQWVMGMVHLW